MTVARTRRSLHVMVVAGEASGDALGAGLMGALQSQTGGAVRFSGVGGPQMVARGLESLFPMQELSLMGIAEVLPKVPQLRRRLREVEYHALASAPDVVVTIDSPGFNFRLARRLRPERIKLIHYVAPSVWAWRPGRARKIAPLFDHLLTLLPFEPPYFEAEGLRATFVGHPVIETAAANGDGPGFRARHGIAPDAPLLCVLPGSRRSETSRLLAPFGETMRALAKQLPNLAVAVPAVPHLEADIRAAVSTWGVPVAVTTQAEKYDAMAAANAAMAASGTVALELAMARVPSVIAYRMHPITWMLVKRLAKTPYVNLVNVLLKRSVVPELLQQDCTPEKLTAALSELLRNPTAQVEQKGAASEALAMLRSPTGSPSDAAADAVLKVVDGQMPASTARAD